MLTRVVEALFVQDHSRPLSQGSEAPALQIFGTSYIYATRYDTETKFCMVIDVQYTGWPS